MRAREALIPPARLRWKKVWETDDGRGNVQRYLAGRGVTLFDAWYDGTHLGQTHGLRLAKQLVLRAAETT